MKAFEIRNVNKTVKHNAVLHDISFSIEEGEVVSLIGPNGAGKSTIMKIASRLVFPDSGRVVICGNDLEKSPVEALSKLSAMIEAPALYPQFTGRQHLEMVARLRGKGGKDVEKYVEFCNIGDKIDKRIVKYSLGMKQRLYLSMALLPEPELLLLDEPTNGLDFDGVTEFRQRINSLAQQGAGILLSSHVLSDLSKISDKFIFIEKGRILNIVKNDREADIESLYRDIFAGSSSKG